MMTKLNTCAAMLSVAVAVSACTSSNTVRTSADTAIVKTRAAPICGGAGAARVAQLQAAIETIRAGYDRYVIVDGASANNVQVGNAPGTFRTTGVVHGNVYSGTTTYQPGIPIIRGTHDQAFAIRIFRDSDPGAGQALSARQTLGPKWQEMVKAGRVNTCA